ncbi:MAG TPA: hypothetical protein VLC53_05145, partial [Myxococcota bacterium]|nr:hypothetical protein [Myxococcota bacterium]
RDIYQPLFGSRPAVITLQVKPRGEVFVDGVSRGIAPPLAQIEVAPGKRHIQVRSAGAKPYDARIDLEPGQRLTISHTFVRPAPRKPGFWQDLKRRFGGS